ncbi:MAG: ribonuclease E/G [Pseudomonadota bacterium]|nr:ribonuclease E/G [Pseudomonadota bacterium]
MPYRMLIDANHDEETRVIVLNKEGKIEEFDIEAKDRNQIRGNIYLAKVTRVEPSLQAAFVEYGGNRHGFLAFNEIHPDYYQIPTSERKKLLDEETELVTNTDASDDVDETESDEAESVTNHEGSKRSSKQRKRYKIQEVIKKRQIILVQVTKEERGNKGAALTSYISLAGRYCVLMPNTARGGGISRKISDIQTRNKIKASIDSLKIPDGMGVIIRTAGAQRTKTEIKRDFEYLTRLWQTIRDLTLNSSAPELIYEEGSLVKRSIRDLYNKDVEEIVISGENAFIEAKNFMKMLIPSHVKFIKKYSDTVPLFIQYDAESELDNMFHENVRLPSGGYLVINQTEALVAIDVNSGRSTREHNIEDTALRTNLEASDEVARQLRLRDLAGLIVIDYIDMEERRNNRSVEKQLKDALRSDRARIQVGHISQFGLMEMSRQRMRSSLLERAGSISSQSVQIIRAIEQDLFKNGKNNIKLYTNNELSGYLLNTKRKNLYEIEDRYGITIEIAVAEIDGGETFKIERSELKLDPMLSNSAVSIDSVYEDKSDVKASIDDEAEQEINAKTEPKPKQTAKRKSPASQKKIKTTSKRTNKKDKSEMDEEIADTKTTTKPTKQKKVETNKRNNKKAGDPVEDKKITKAKKVTAKKKPPSKEKIENTLKPVENPKTGWWDD